MTTTPISDSTMYYSEPHGFKAVPYSVARDLELELTELKEVAQAVVERWDTPSWEDVPYTAIYINRLREQLNEQHRKS